MTHSRPRPAARRPLLALLSLVLLSCLVRVAHAQRLFISAYMHTAATSTIEIFNPSCSAVTLTTVTLTPVFVLRVAPYTTHPAGAIWNAASVPFGFGSATIAAHGTVSVTLTLSGSDAVGLFHNDILIDVIGSIMGMVAPTCINCASGVARSGAPWDVSGTKSATYLHSMRRRARVTEGTTDWFHPKGAAVSDLRASEWDVYSVGTNTLSSNAAMTALTGLTCPPFGSAPSLFFATCGTTGASLPTGSSQVVCPVDCLMRIAQNRYNLVPLLPVQPVIVGSGTSYSTATPVCLAAIHGGIITTSYNTPPVTSPVVTTAVIGTMCLHNPISSQPLYSDASVFPASNRPNGRPHIKVTQVTTARSVYAATSACLTSTAASTAGYDIALLNTTLCDSTQCGGSQQGYCNQNTGLCLCNSPHFGDYCERKDCPFTCFNPLTVVAGCATLTAKGTCGCDTTTGTCSCAAGWSGPQCTFVTDCACLNGGQCNHVTGECTCPAPYFGVKCASKLCMNNCTGTHGTCDFSTALCTCDPSYAGEDCSLIQCGDYCRGFGMCDFELGECRCRTSAGNNKNAAVPTQCLWDTCPTNSTSVCTGHGVCDYATRACHCYSGWVGENCATVGG